MPIMKRMLNNTLFFGLFVNVFFSKSLSAAYSHLSEDDLSERDPLNAWEILFSFDAIFFVLFLSWILFAVVLPKKVWNLLKETFKLVSTTNGFSLPKGVNLSFPRTGKPSAFASVCNLYWIRVDKSH